MRNYLYNLATDKYQGVIANLIKSLLFILSLIYGLTVRILILFYRLTPYRLNCKVISVGNITLGGTGKTSLVEYIARYLKQQGHKVAILSRGYKRKAIDYRPLTMDYLTMGDEPYMLSKKLDDIPVIVDTDRIRAANQAIKDYKVDTVILDDGLQQWRIKKNLEIVAIDVTDPFGNRHLLPRGILREPLSSLRRAHLLVLTKTNLNPDIQDIKDFLIRINSGAQILESIHKPVGFYQLGKEEDLLNIDVLKGKTVTLISGIGDPDSFENLIISLGINIGMSFRFPDHHDYTNEDLDNIVKSSQDKNIDTIVTTEKDAARLNNLQLIPNAAIQGSYTSGSRRDTKTFTTFGTTYNLQLLILRIELKLTKNEEGLHNRLLRLYSR